MSNQIKTGHGVLVAIIALVGVSFLGSVMGIFARLLAVDLSTVQQVALRSFIGVFVLLAVCWRQIDLKKIYGAPISDIRLTIGRAISMSVIAISLATVAYTHGNYASVAIIMALPAAAVLGVVMFGEKISFKEIVLVAIAFLGACLTIVARTGLTVNVDWPLICALLSTTFAAYSHLARKWQSPFLNIYETTFLMILSATIIMTTLSALQIFWSGDTPDISAKTVVIAFIAAIANLVFLLLANFAIPKLTAVMTNNILALQPLFGTGVGFLFYGELLAPTEVLGGTLILIAIVLVANPTLLSKLLANKN